MNIEIGDKIRFSTELLQHIHSLPDHRSEMVKVVRVENDEVEPSCKIVFVEREDV
jgi:hypothetical protein